VLSKGAPEVVQGMLAKVPPHYQQCYKRYASEGARVLAMAYKQLPSEMTPSELRHLPRDHAESELVFAGQLVAAHKEDRQPRSSPAISVFGCKVIS
jgi:cation-transporting ATPase 13A1